MYSTIVLVVAVVVQLSFVDNALIHRLQHQGISLAYQGVNGNTTGGGDTNSGNSGDNSASLPDNNSTGVYQPTPSVSIVTTPQTEPDTPWYKTDLFLGVFASKGFLTVCGIAGLLVTLYRKKRLKNYYLST